MLVDWQSSNFGAVHFFLCPAIGVLRAHIASKSWSSGQRSAWLIPKDDMVFSSSLFKQILTL